MVFRITPHRQYELGQVNAQQKFSQSARLQQDISSGIRIHRPSDDPQGQKIVLNQQTAIDRFATQLENLNQARTVLNNAQVQLRDAQQLIVRAKSISLEAAQATEESERNVMADELDSILNQLEAIANSAADGKYLFAGTRTGDKPFTNVVEGHAIYSGANQPGLISLAGQPNIKVYYTGQEVFQPPAGGSLVISGNTGVAPGSGTSSGSAPTTLTIRHTLTTYAAGSGLQAGTSSADGDTIIGATGQHQVVIQDTSGTGAFGTISLDGGPEIAWTSSDSDLQVTGPQGDVIYVNTQSITAGFSGTVDLTADGTLSIDGGVTEVPIDFSQNQVLTSEALGVVQHLDTRQVSRTGSVQVEQVQTADVFQVIKSLRDDLRNVHNLSPDDLNAALNRRIGNLDQVNDHLLAVIGQQSVSLQHLDGLQSRLEDLKLNATQSLSEVQGTDYTTAIMQLQEQQNLLQYTLASLTTLTNVSILDFLS